MNEREAKRRIARIILLSTWENSGLFEGSVDKTREGLGKPSVSRQEDRRMEECSGGLSSTLCNNVSAMIALQGLAH